MSSGRDLAITKMLQPKTNSTVHVQHGQQIARAIEVMQQEASAIAKTAELVDAEFCRAVDMLSQMRGALLITGMGKAGLIGKKLAATFASTGTPAHFVHPSEAFHGDLGKFGQHDVVIALSNSGETEEVVRLASVLETRIAGLITLTSCPQSSLAQSSDVVLAIASGPEACAWNLAPTCSTTAMLACGDALAIVVSETRGFTAADFAMHHPGGSLGLKLMHASQAMRPLDQCRMAQESSLLREILVTSSITGRRSGAIMLTDTNGTLTGIFTDSDLARLLERKLDQQLDRPVAEVMTTKFTAIDQDAKMQDAVELLADRKISELPVIDADDRPVGMLDVTDVIALVSPALRQQLAQVGNSSVKLLPKGGKPSIRIFR